MTQARADCRWQVLSQTYHWLRQAADGSGLGCVACSWARSRTSFGSLTAQFKASTLKLHAEKAFHIQNYRAWMAKENTDKFISSIACPQRGEFKSLLQRIQKGEATLRDTKQRNMSWCLWEAAKIMMQQRVLAARIISLSRDESAQVFAIRCRMVDDQCAVHHGFMGQERSPGAGAKAMTEATKRVLVRFATNFIGCPAAWKATQFNRQLLEHIRRSTTSIVVDAAADELLSSSMLRTPGLREDGSMVAVLPHLKFIIRDSAHASRRVISRPWFVDPQLQCVINIWGRDNRSFPQRMQHAKAAEECFRKHIKSCSSRHANRVVNLKAAKHRFESFARPLGRSILHLTALLNAAAEISSTRRADALGVDTAKWLSSLTNEAVLLGGLLADAADEALNFTRTLDDESVEACALSVEAKAFLSRIRQLFVAKQCLHIVGYTGMALAWLRTSRVWAVPGHGLLQLGFDGEIPAALVETCISRMQTWCRLATSTVEAEFPDFMVTEAL